MNEQSDDKVIDEIPGEEEVEETEGDLEEEDEDESSASDDKYKLLQAQFTKVSQELADIKRQQQQPNVQHDAELEGEEDEDSVLAEYGLDDATPNEKALAQAVASQRTAIRQLIGLIKPMYKAYEGDRVAIETATKFTGLLNREVSVAEARKALDESGGDAVAAFAALARSRAPQRDKPKAVPGSVRPSQGKPMTTEEIVEYAARKAGLR